MSQNSIKLLLHHNNIDKWIQLKLKLILLTKTTRHH